MKNHDAKDENENSLIIYNTIDGKASVVLYAHDGSVWMNLNQLAELFDTSVPNISMHIANVLKEGEQERNSVIKNYFTTAFDGKKYEIGRCALSGGLRPIGERSYG